MVVLAGRWKMGHMIVVSGVLAVFSWNAGNRALTPVNGILFINLVPVTTFVLAITPEAVGAAVTIAALVANNLHQRRVPRGPSAS